MFIVHSFIHMSYFFMILPIHDTDSTTMVDLAMRDSDGSRGGDDPWLPPEDSDLVVLRRDNNSALSMLILPAGNTSKGNNDQKHNIYSL
jgi:hypothetical protein